LIQVLQSGARKLQSGAAFQYYKAGKNNYKSGQSGAGIIKRGKITK